MLRRGIVANPDYWRLWQDLGFIYYWDLKDYKQAVRVFETGSERPGAQVWLTALAATVAAKGGDPQASKLLWTQIYRHAENEAMRESALDHLAALTAHEQIQELNDLLDKYRTQEGRPASSIQDLIAAGLLRGVPVDPSGIPYTVGPDGKAALGANSKVKLRLIL